MPKNMFSMKSNIKLKKKTFKFRYFTLYIKMISILTKNDGVRITLDGNSKKWLAFGIGSDISTA